MLDLVKNGEIQFIINTPSGKIPRKDEVKIRSAALGATHPDHDHPARGQGERRGHPLPAKGTDDGARACRNTIRRAAEVRRFTEDA